MAAPIYRDEFERRFLEMVGFVNTSIESQRLKLIQDINGNTNAKFAAVITHYDREIAEVKQQLQENNQLLRAIAQALNIKNI